MPICERYPDPSTHLRRSKSQCKLPPDTNIEHRADSGKPGADDIVRDAASAAAATFPIAEAVPRSGGLVSSCHR